MNSSPLSFQQKIEKGKIDVANQQLSYVLYECDARTPEQRLLDGESKRLEGNLNVFIPGHGQKAWTAKELIQSIARHNQSRLVWAVDVEPPIGGDPVKAQALVRILQQKMGQEFTADENQPINLFGWSHGGGDALRTAGIASELFPRVVSMCPAGMVERKVTELVLSFTMECLRIFVYILFKSPRHILQSGRIVADILAGVLGDILRRRSLKRAAEDIRWICKKVPGENYTYRGIAVIQFGENDTVIRWKDVFPACSSPSEIKAQLMSYKNKNFPLAERLEVQVLEGNHASPEIDADRFVRAAMKVFTGETARVER